MSEQANAMTKQGFDQHNLLHLQWPQNCCLCRAETDLAALRAECERLHEALEPLAGIARMYASSNSDDESAYVTLGLLRHAAAALKGDADDEG